MLRKFQVTSVSDGNYYFIVVPWIWISVVQVLAVVLLIPNCACWVFLLTLVFYLVFRYSLIKFAWDGSSHFMMSMHTLLRFIKQISRLNNSLILRTIVWSFGCRLNLFGRVSRCGVLDNIFVYHLAYMTCVPANVRIYRGDSAEIY